MDTWVIAVLAFVAVGGVMAYQHFAHKKKVAALMAYANQRGWRYAERDHSLVDRFQGQPFGDGHGRQARHVLSGSHRGRQTTAFEYIYKENRGSGDDRRTKTYEFTVVAVTTPAPRPTLEVTREGLGRKLLGLVGVRDLQLESEEFNKTFHIRAEDDKFAYDILNPQMMEWMLSSLALEVPFRFERADLVVWQPGNLETSTVDGLVEYACDVLDRTPTFVWK